MCDGDDHEDALLDGAASALLSTALRANRTLQTLALRMVMLWDDAPAAVALLGALTGHPSIRSLDFGDNQLDDEAGALVIGAALGVLLAANAPALQSLDLSYCDLGDGALGPLVDALPQNTHLHEVRLLNSRFSAGFAARRLLPAVRVNTALRTLAVSSFEAPTAALAAALVEARHAARVAAEAAAAVAPYEQRVSEQPGRHSSDPSERIAQLEATVEQLEAEARAKDARIAVLEAEVAVADACSAGAAN
jgi:hypothetical protein